MKPDLTYHLQSIIAEFSIDGTIESVRPFGSGHINGSFHLKNVIAEGPDYLLQSINTYVFKDVPALINNVKLVTEHLRKQVIANNGDPKAEVLTMIETKTGEYYHRDHEGNYWRVYLFLKNTKSYDILETDVQAFEGGRAFGRFQSMLSSLDASLLRETIPNFHNVQYRLQNLELAIRSNALQRAKNCGVEIDFIFDRVEKMSTIFNLGKSGELPLRVIHNDTKFNNILFNQEDHVQCVIDLDTVMPGFVAFDFGDAIRTVINNAAEDEADLSKITLNVRLFEAYAKGYLQEAVHFLNSSELNSLTYGVLLLPYLQAGRFLTDYLDGDRYFKIHFAEHNLQRARAQLKLVKELEAHELILQGIIEDILLAKRSKDG